MHWPEILFGIISILHIKKMKKSVHPVNNMIEYGKLSATGWLLRFVAESLSLALCFTPLRRSIYILLV